MEQNRVCCLYRVSTDKQVDYDNNHEADIPMQRKACHRFAEKMGWNIVHEEQEDGVSGHKVRAENRDKIQTIKELARKGKFDILLVFMFDRIGRIADETPFVVEWFVKNGIQVWSTQEGEQRFDNHIDKLLNYIRFWQADGESEKTSIRTKTSLGQMVEEGHYKGGTAPVGYELVKSGRFNKRKHELYDLKVKEGDAKIVRLIFEKYVNEGYGVQKIANYLNANGYRNPTGNPWSHNTIRNILQNETYVGILRSGNTRSPYLPELQIVDRDLFDKAQDIRRERAESKADTPRVPLNMRGQSLLSGNVFCGHCGDVFQRTHWSLPSGKTIVWRCVSRLRKKTSGIDCPARTVTEADLHKVIVTAVNQALDERDSFLPALKESVGKALSSSNSRLIAEVDAKLEKLQKELLKKANAKQAFDSIADQIEDLREEKRQLLLEDATNEGVMQKVRELEEFIDSQGGPVTEYDEALVRRLIEKVTVYDDHFTVEFKSGLETDVMI